ncbi:hypothetical protein [Adhaeribacter pallidiroseus]|uniref:Uncharacterized protein n=1 Tax=Adhaeribacter pallidiroseus TaxID=2072847 RepID=A0A369QAJ8_9BACT|nr:hypothetical protein [Adhaeribacter pallidiroseus]RDC61724.1 hypothetical protein AHMF7616_00306 [Adhaeribacter pallidiroseus]
MGSLIICFTSAFVIYYYLNFSTWAKNNLASSSAPRVLPQAKALQYELIKLGIKARLERFTNQEQMVISIPESKITIEIEGTQVPVTDKNPMHDLRRTHYSLVNGHYTIRIPNSLIKSNLMQSVHYVNRIIASHKTNSEQAIAYPFEYSLLLNKAS